MVEVSVIIPVYNSEPWLEECLNSVCNQTLKNIEILCVNDGSTDHSPDILFKFAELDKRIIVINWENGGASKARNTGMNYANGKYVYFLDSDDYIAGDALEILVREMQERDLEILCFNANVIVEDGVDKNFKRRETDYFRRIREYPKKCKGEDLYRLFWDNEEYIVSVCTMLADRSFLIGHSLEFPEGIIHEDELVVFKSLLLASKAGYLDRSLYYRRVRPNSVMDLQRPGRLLFSSFSLFICVKQALRIWCSAEFKKENEEAVFSNIERMVTICRNRYGRLNETEKSRLMEMAGKDQYYFRLLIRDSHDSNETIKRLRAEAERNSEKCRKLESEKKKLNKLITGLKNSRSYKIGRILTWIPRKIRELARRTHK